jgi:hypothetical protein
MLTSKVFSNVNAPRAFDLAPDGKHVRVWTAPDSSDLEPSPIWVVTNWFADLRQRVAAAQK